MTMKEMTLKEIQKALGYEVKIVADNPREKYSNVQVGGIVTIADVEWIVLDKNDKDVLCLTKDLVYKNTIFDNSINNYAKSSLRQKLNGDFLESIVNEVGKHYVLNAEIDLMSLDGLNDFGKITDKTGLLTLDMYRKYSRIIEKYPVNSWWWLATPWSTEHRGWRSAVCRVRGGGSVDCGSCGSRGGVRPFCIFSSSIFES